MQNLFKLRVIMKEARENVKKESVGISSPQMPSSSVVAVRSQEKEDDNESLSAPLSEIARREILRRQKAIQDAEKLYEEALKFQARGKLEAALVKAEQAMDMLPSGSISQEHRLQGESFVANVRIALADRHIKEKRFSEANRILTEVLHKNSEDRRALSLMKKSRWQFKQLGGSQEGIEEKRKIRKLISEAKRHYASRQYDLAIKRFQEVLDISEYHKVAIKGLRNSFEAKSDFYHKSYQSVRSEFLFDVDKEWAVKGNKRRVSSPKSQTSIPLASGKGASLILSKLKSIMIPMIDFEGVTLEDAIEFLRQRTFELDDENPSKRGLNFVIQGTPKEEVIHLELKNIPLSVALDYICQKTGMRYKVGEFAVTLLPRDIDEVEMFIRSFTVAADFMSQLGDETKGEETEETPLFFKKKSPNKKSILSLLSGIGATFPKGATAIYNRGASTLIVRNTQPNLDLLEALVESMHQVPRQVRIQSKFIEIAQNDDEELGLDWLITPFKLDGDNSYISGGSDTPVRTAVAGTELATRTGGRALTSITNGLRSGGFASGRDTVQDLLLNPTTDRQQRSLAPGILGVSGIYGDEAFQVILRGISQKQGSDILIAPSITVKSGQKAHIEVVREFIYPKEYSEPQIPNEVSSSDSSSGTPVATPAHPTSFETRNLGVTLKVSPNLGTDNQTINLKFTPEVIEFEGFVNYGSAIYAGLGTNRIELTRNRIEQPIFSTRRLSTDVTVYDGYTVAVGGLMREDVSSTDDKVPLLGDIPVLGRLFKSKTENRKKRNLMIFVTADIIDPTGQPLRNSESSLGGISQ